MFYVADWIYTTTMLLLVAFSMVQCNLLSMTAEFVAIEINCDCYFGTALLFYFFLVYLSLIMDSYMIVKMEVQWVILLKQTKQSTKYNSLV